MEFEKGKIYRFEAAGLYYGNSGQAYISLKGANDKRYSVRALRYQEDWVDVPKFIECIVVQENPLTLSQSRFFLLKDRFPQKNVWHKFFVRGNNTDPETGCLYYELRDEFDLTHRYYPKEGEVIEGEEVDLWVSGINRKDSFNSHLYLSLHKPADFKPSQSYSYDYSDAEIPGGESAKVEFKSSLVYPAGTTEPDIDSQTKVIMQSLAGMMNAEGGTLYLGVNDDGNIRSGIENDFEFLNSSRIDHRTYKTDLDGYQNKLYSAIKDYLGGYAKTLARIELKQSVRHNGKNASPKYAVLTVDPSTAWPIWVRGNALFVRTGNNTTHLFGDEITQFIWKRFSSPSMIPFNKPELVTDVDAHLQESDITPIMSIEQTRQELKVESSSVHATFDLFDKEKPWGYLYFFKGMDRDLNAQVIPSRNAQPRDYEYRVILPRDYNNYDLVICYENGVTDWVSLETALFTTKGKPKNSFYFSWKSGRAIVNAFCVKNNQKNRDLVAYVSTKNGTPFVKCNVLTSLTSGKPHKNLDNAGNVMLEHGSDLKYAMRVSGDKQSRMLLEEIGLVYDDRNNHKNGRRILSMTEKSKNILSEIINLYLCSVQDDVDYSPAANDVIAVPAEVPAMNSTYAKLQDDACYSFDSAWVYQDGRSFFVTGSVFSQLGSMWPSTVNPSLRSLVKLWDLDENKPAYIFMFKNSFYFSEYTYNSIFNAITKAQADFFNTKDPMSHSRISQRDIADRVGLSDSTVSRALDGVRIFAPGGVITKDDLLASSGVGDISEAHCVQLIKELRKKDPDMGDQDLADAINHRLGTNIARRTIAKYRRRAHISNSRGEL